MSLLLISGSFSAMTQSRSEVNRWKKQAKNVTIIRDNFGVPHIYGKTDADAVFGLLYAQCEDDFKRVEMNYIEKLGRLSEVRGESELYNDLLIRLIIDSADAVRDYNKSPEWLKKLMNAYADGINYYLYKHPEVKPALLKRFKPWYTLLWTDGSIGAISTGGATVSELQAYYEGKAMPVATISNKEVMPTGSNGFAFAPSITASGKSILYINPHVTFYFRPEVHMVSEEGLNVYGAVTWGQFFIYQGFNEKCGWMHTSSNVDVADLYKETTMMTDRGERYEYEGKWKQMWSKNIRVAYMSKNGKTKNHTFPSRWTHHGPVVAKRNSRLITLKSNNRSLQSLMQSWQRTKAKSFAEFKNVMELRSNTSNNTVYADAEGNIAYWHGNFIPVRDTIYNWAKEVDGSTAMTEWKGLHSVNESVHMYNPVNGWLQNCNSTPFSVAGKNSPRPENYPLYMAPDGENYRGVNAVRLLEEKKGFTIDKVIEMGYNTYMAAFVKLIPALMNAWENAPGKENYQQQLNILKNWDLHAAENSVATTLAVTWGEKLISYLNAVPDEDEYNYADHVLRTDRLLSTIKPVEIVQSFKDAIQKLNTMHGTWNIAWGAINRYQRISSDINQNYNDADPSEPVAFTSATWGMLPSYVSTYFTDNKKRYGTHGNSFIAAVEFGERVKAKSLLAGGQSGDPNSKHFADQLLMYTKGKFKDVLFYQEDVLKHAKKIYHPGE